ncbi:MAG: hypothetical protein Ct9H90mP27_6000 [Gammaproteobacteria bacterium]|nr:MAG: hypothetical protein Ct9H90mP27_6000 [Gammaproteobacteria bacterium]
MGFDQNMGSMYPFSLAEKLQAITEDHEYYHDAKPGCLALGKTGCPLEMISVLTQYTSGYRVIAREGPL